MPNKPLTLLAGLGLGAVALYYLDPEREKRRRVPRGRLRRPSKVEDGSLVDRVRAELGDRVVHPRGIQVVAENGCVTLTGSVPPDEITEARETAASVPGVVSVENQLITQSER